MNMKQTAKYLVAVAFGFVLCAAANRLFLSPDRNDATSAVSSDQLVLLKWQKASAAANMIRTSLRNEGLDVAIGSDDSINALIVLADKQTTKLARERIRELDTDTPSGIN